MKLNNIKWFTGSLMTVALAAGISACSDDHFDITSDTAGKQTIWKTIQSDERLSNFAECLLLKERAESDPRNLCRSAK